MWSCCGSPSRIPIAIKSFNTKGEGLRLARVLEMDVFAYPMNTSFSKDPCISIYSAAPTMEGEGNLLAHWDDINVAHKGVIHFPSLVNTVDIQEGDFLTLGKPKAAKKRKTA